MSDTDTHKHPARYSLALALSFMVAYVVAIAVMAALAWLGIQIVFAVLFGLDHIFGSVL